MTDRQLYTLLLAALLALGVWCVRVANATPLSTPQFGTEYKAPVPTLINHTLPVLVGAGPCRYYTGTQYGSVPATALVWLDSVDVDGNSATYRRVVYWPKHGSTMRLYTKAGDEVDVPNPYQLKLETTEYTLVMRPWATRLDPETAVSGERYEWDDANE